MMDFLLSPVVKATVSTILIVVLFVLCLTFGAVLYTMIALLAICIFMGIIWGLWYALLELFRGEL
jgi:hypothetical protein